MFRSYRELTVDEAHAICECLKPFVSEARAERFRAVLKQRTRHIVLVLEDIYSDHNNAAVLRTADALGLAEIHHVSRLDAIRASSRVALGSEKWVELIHHLDVRSAFDALRQDGRCIWAASVHGRRMDIDAVPVEKPMALVFGNEHSGLSEYAREHADGCFEVPMVGFAESLNVSVAAAIALDRVLTRAGRPPLGEDDQLRLRACFSAQSVRASETLLAQAGLPMVRLSKALWAWSDGEEEDERA